MGNRAMAILVGLGLLALLSPGCHRRSRTGKPPVAPARSLSPTWGDRVEGLQCRIRPVKRLWEPGRTIVFKLDLRNAGKRVFAVSEPVRAQRVAVDGRWYPWPRGPEGQTKVRPLGPDAELANLSLKVPPTRHLSLTPGRHTIQIVMEFEGIEVASGPVGIEIAATP